MTHSTPLCRSVSYLVSGDDGGDASIQACAINQLRVSGWVGEGLRLHALDLKGVGGDGNCFFRSVAYQLSGMRKATRRYELVPSVDDTSTCPRVAFFAPGHLVKHALK